MQNAKCLVTEEKKKKKIKNLSMSISKIFFAKNLSYPFQDILQQ